MAEPKLKYCTVREGDSEWHLECRFSDGQKYAAIKIDGDCPELATRVAALLNGNVWTDERPSEPGEYWLSIQPAKRAGRYDFPKVIPCEVSMCANAYLMDIGSLALGGDKAGCTLAVRYITGGAWIPINDAWFDGSKWSRRETPADPFEEVTT